MLAIEAIKKLKRDALPSLIVLAGEDTGQYDQLKQALFQAIDYDASDLTMGYFDLREADFEAVAMDLESLPFFAEEKLVLLDYAVDLTTSKHRALSDEELKRLEAYLENPVETTKLILLAPGKLDSKRRLVKLLKRDAQVFEATSLKEAELRQYFAKAAQDMGIDLSSQLLEELLIKSNFDFSQIQQNLSLLLAYRGQGEVTAQDIALAIPKSLQDNIFDLTQLILAGRIDPARSLVKDLTLQGEDEIKLIAIMLNQFRLFTQVRLLQNQGQSESQMLSSLTDILGRKVNPYQVKFAIRDSRQLSLEQLQTAVKTLIETDFNIKTGVNDKSYLFDLALLKLAVTRP